MPVVTLSLFAVGACRSPRPPQPVFSNYAEHPDYRVDDPPPKPPQKLGEIVPGRYTFYSGRFVVVQQARGLDESALRQARRWDAFVGPKTLWLKHVSADPMRFTVALDQKAQPASTGSDDSERGRPKRTRSGSPKRAAAQAKPAPQFRSGGSEAQRAFLVPGSSWPALCARRDLTFRYNGLLAVVPHGSPLYVLASDGTTAWVGPAYGRPSLAEEIEQAELSSEACTDMREPDAAPSNWPRIPRLRGRLRYCLFPSPSPKGPVPAVELRPGEGVWLRRRRCNYWQVQVWRQGRLLQGWIPAIPRQGTASYGLIAPPIAFARLEQAAKLGRSLPTQVEAGTLVVRHGSVNNAEIRVTAMQPWGTSHLLLGGRLPQTALSEVELDTNAPPPPGHRRFGASRCWQP